jgi:hypothetical protein
MKVMKMSEYIKGVQDGLILEMARINDKDTFNYDVFVYGGDSYGSGRNEHGEPHFHFSDNIKNPQRFNFSILIPTPTEWSQNKDLYIYETLDNNYNWVGLKKEKKELIRWLDEINYIDKFRTNLEFIILQWNILNTDNKNVKKINI